MNLNDEFECLDRGSQIKLLNIYNSHFTGSSLWNFGSETFKQLQKSWNVNLRIVCNLPLTESISGCKHVNQKIFSRYIGFINSLFNSKKMILSSLLKIVYKDSRSSTGSNIKTILQQTGTLVIPGSTHKGVLNVFVVYKTPPNQEWRFPLLVSLLELRESNWTVTFDEEEETSLLEKDAIDQLIDSVCIL